MSTTVARVERPVAAPRRRSRAREIQRCTRARFDEILADLDAFWGRGDAARRQVIRHLHHPMFVHEFGDTAYVICEGGRVVAYLLGFLVPARRLAYVHFVAVRRDCQRGGLATRLYSHFMRRARRAGCVRIKAITSPANVGSVAFHARLGMKAIGAVGVKGIPVVADYSGPGADRVVMVGTLGRSAQRERRRRGS